MVRRERQSSQRDKSTKPGKGRECQGGERIRVKDGHQSRRREESSQYEILEVLQGFKDVQSVRLRVLKNRAKGAQYQSTGIRIPRRWESGISFPHVSDVRRKELPGQQLNGIMKFSPDRSKIIERLCQITEHIKRRE